MSEERDGAEERREEPEAATRYKVGVGEDFPLLEEPRRGRVDFSAEWRCGHGWDGRARDWRAHREGWHGGYGMPRIFILFLAIAALVALVSAAASYPLATLGVIAVLLLLAGPPRRRRRSFDYRDWSRSDDGFERRRPGSDAA